MNRRDFVKKTSVATVASIFSTSVASAIAKMPKGRKMKVVLVGTGIRGTGMWGKNLVDNYSDYLEFVALCDINPGRLEYAKEYMGVNCKTYLAEDFDKMISEQTPDSIIVTTMDSNHDQYITRAMELGVNVISEKPMTTDEVKCQNILDTEKKTGKNLTVTFNYRYGPYMTKVKQLLQEERVGKITSVDFHWYLNPYHGASYFRRWHGEKDKGGTLLVHKSTHHFDLLNWWLNSDPAEVFAYGDLEHYGANNPFRGEKCRGCAHIEQCGGYYWDITKDERSMKLYVENEKYDGYIRDNCLWRKEIDIYDKMAVQIKYANNVQVSYSLTTYSPYEGYRVSFNGTKGRIDAWEGIPFNNGDNLDQSKLHSAEMDQGNDSLKREPIIVMDNFNKEYETIWVEIERGGHGGGDGRLLDKIFVDPAAADPYKHSAGSRDGSFSILIGIAARKSIEENRPVKVESLTSLKPHPTRES